jgi:hypothetical protein
MIQPISPVAGLDPSALLSALVSAKSTTESQVRRFMAAMVRVHEADARFDSAQAKYELGSNALLLHRIHTLLYGAPAGTPVEPEAIAPAQTEVAAAYGEFQSLRASMLQATAEVDTLLAKAEEGLAAFDQKWRSGA